MRPSAALLIIVVLAACGPKQAVVQEAPHELTEIPFNIDNLSDEQTRVIRSGNESDTTPYLIRSRPVVFQIVLTGNDADELRFTGPIEQQVDVLIYALGEAEDDRLVDYGWIEHVESGATVWKMTPENSVYAGGDPRNRKAVARLTLETGVYHLRYVSNSSHAYPDWQGAAPERERFYGVTVFNMTALPLIEERLKQAGVPGLGTSLKPPDVRRISIETPKGRFEVWTRKVGDNPRIKVLLLHGGPGATHEYLLNFEDHLPAAGIEFYFYDQLGSFNSDRPDDPDLWILERFVDEVEQVRKALGLDASNFYLWGTSWGGLLAIEYALEHQENLKGLVVSNMMASIPAYNDYAKNVLMASMDPKVLAEIEALEAAEDYDNPRYMELLIEHHYVDHVLRRPADQWPGYVNAAFEHINPDVYVLMQGPSELGAGGRLESWDRTTDLGRITVPTLVIGATHDTMDPEHMKWMAGNVANGRFLLCPDGSHMAHIDDEQVYFDGLIRFIQDVDEGKF